MLSIENGVDSGVYSSMIFYGQDETQIVFFLDEPVTNAISEWNCRNYSDLELESYEQQGFNPKFQITLHKELNQINEIEIEQVHPSTKQGETFKQRFTAQQGYELHGLPLSMMHGFKEARSEPPDYKPSPPRLKLNLVEYFYLINDWREWTRETALSGRYIYGFGHLELISGDGWYEYLTDGWIEDTVSGVTLELYHRSNRYL